MSNKEVFDAVKTGYRLESPDDCSEEIYSQMHLCWKMDPQQRPSFQQLSSFFDRIWREQNGDNLNDHPLSRMDSDSEDLYNVG